jgi:hypothetical protein
MKNTFKYIYILAPVLLTAACNKQLEKLPDNRAVITSVDQVTQLLTSAYPHAMYAPFTEPMSDNAEDKGTAPQGTDPVSYQINSQAYGFQDITSFRFDSPTAYWDSCYRAIATANLALTYCNGPDSASYSAQKGEALVCRAYAHFMLVCLFAKPYDPTTSGTDPGIPYVTTVQTSVFQTYKRGTVAADYAAIESDLTRGLALIQDRIYGVSPKFHFTLQAAHAFASRFYMFKQDYNSAITHANAVFGTTDPATLIRDQVKLYGTLQYQQLSIFNPSSGNSANILLQEAQSSYFDSYYQYRYGLGLGLQSTVLGGNNNVTGGSYAVTVYGATPQYFNFPKWSSYNVGPANQNIKYGLMPLFSMEEVLLNRAEAYAWTGNYNAALTDLNSWVSKNVDNYKPATNNVTQQSAVNWYGAPVNISLVLAALDFKRVTYFQEGLRWFDNIRLGFTIYRFAGNDFSFPIDSVPFNDKRRVLLLPAEAVTAGLEQNPR